MRVLVAGTGHLGTSVLLPLLESHHEVVGIIQNGRSTRGAQRVSRIIQARLFGGATDVIAMAMKNNLPVVWLDTMDDDDLAPIRALESDLIVTCGFGLIFNRPLLDLPAIGCMNVHSSLLPKHRGATPFPYVILANDSESGVTFHVTDEQIDTGDVLDRTAFPVGPADTALTVYGKACDRTRERVVEVVDHIAQDGLHGTPQDTEFAGYDKKFTEKDTGIRWGRPTSTVDRLIRASTASSYARFKHRGRTVRLVSAEIDTTRPNAPPGTVLETTPRPVVATLDGTITIRSAFVSLPIPWMWPAPWSRLRVGDRLR